jgi:hypothetical protein
MGKRKYKHRENIYNFSIWEKSGWIGTSQCFRGFTQFLQWNAGIVNLITPRSAFSRSWTLPIHKDLPTAFNIVQQLWLKRHCSITWESFTNPLFYLYSDLLNLLVGLQICLTSLFFLFGLWDYRHCGHSWPIVPASGDNEDDCGEHDGM